MYHPPVSHPVVRVHLSPVLVEPAGLAGGFVLVIDLLRASTTIVHALGAGAARVIPCEEINEAKARAAQCPGSLLGGERSGVRIDGFDLGNSPAEYTPDRVRGRTVVFTTTNGTRAIRRAADAETVVVACFANFTAALNAALAAHARGAPLHILCAGIRGEVCLEDVICAGAFARAISDRAGQPLIDDPAHLAAQAWELACSNPRGLGDSLLNTHGGRNVVAIGLTPDIPLCAVVDSCPILPIFDPTSGEIAVLP
jgi:2-phosphosulfolactate phosphatase